MSKFILVVMSAGDCKVCNQLDSFMNSGLKESISQLNVDVIKIKTKSVEKKLDLKKFPKDLKKYRAWFPMIVIFKRARWEACLKGEKKKLKGEIWGGVMGSKGVEDKKSEYKWSHDGIVSWVRNNTR